MPRLFLAPAASTLPTSPLQTVFNPEPVFHSKKKTQNPEKNLAIRHGTLDNQIVVVSRVP
jgi:hypothetical protein